MTKGTLAHACQRIPGLIRAALMLLPDGILLGSIGGDRVSDLEPLVRAMRRVFTLRATPAISQRNPTAFTEYTFVTRDELVVVLAGRSHRFALAAVCSRDATLGFVTSAARGAITELEAELDLSSWGL